MVPHKVKVSLQLLTEAVSHYVTFHYQMEEANHDALLRKLIFNNMNL